MEVRLWKRITIIILRALRLKIGSGSGILKNVFVPFISGIVGASLIIGLCFGVPNVRESILDGKFPENTSNGTEDISKINTTAMSLQGYSDTAMGVAEKILPSIVGIEIEYKVSSFFGNSTAKATGSGIIISEDGYILTNNHVVSTNDVSSTSSIYYQVSNAVSVKVKLYNDDTVYDAEIIGKDDQTDLAVIKIDKTGLTAAELGDSDSVKVGEFAMAVGNPLGLSSSISAGIVSAVNREITTEDNEKYVVIQTDAAINAGNSGGALVNSQGKVIGINTLKLSGDGVEGLGFAIPINSTTDIVKQLMQYNKVIRPYIGIAGSTVTEDMAKKYKVVEGVLVEEVENFTAAQKAGIKAGDIITEVNGKEVDSVDDINEIKNKYNVGDKIKIKLYRDGNYVDVELTLGEQP